MTAGIRRAGDVAGSAEFYERHQGPIRRYILQMVRNPAEADDLTQETFIRAYAGAGSLRDPEAARSWLYRIATNVCYDRFRQSSHRRPVLSLDRLTDIPAMVPWGHRDEPRLDQALEQSEMSSCVQSFLERLPDAYRSVILLHDLEGATNARIAQMLGVSVDLVKIRLHRARRKLKAALEAGCQFSQDDRGVLVCEPADEPQKNI